MSRKILLALVFFGLFGNANAQDGPFRLVHVNDKGVFAIAENSIRTNDQGFRTFKFATVAEELEEVELDGREVMSRWGTGVATMDCSSNLVRLDRLDVLDHNFAVVGSLPAEGFEEHDMPNLTRTVCSSTPADIEALSTAFGNVRSISEVASDYTGATLRSRPRMLWSSLSRQGDQASCLSNAHAAFRSLGYEANAPEADWVGVYGAHPTLAIGALIRCTSPGEFVIFLSQPRYSVGNIDHEVEKIRAALGDD